MSKFIRITNWENYQHYKDRDPTWVKLHRTMRNSRTWVKADDATKLLAICTMMLAADTGNKIPFDPDFIRQVCFLHTDPDFSKLVDLGFIEIVDENGAALAERTKPHQNDSLEKRREEKKEPEAKASGKKTTLPKTFMLTPEREAVAVRKGIPHEHVAREFERFCTWALANNRKYADWDAAWRNWCDSPYQQSRQNSPASPGQRSSPQGGGGVVRAAMAVIAANRERGIRPDGVPGDGATDLDGAGGDTFAFEGFDAPSRPGPGDPGINEMLAGHEVARKAG